MEFLYVLGAGLGMLVILGIIRSHRNNRAVDEFVSQWCRSNGVPDAPFDIKATTREVINGTRPGIPRDGQWWIAKGIEFAGRPSQTRLTFEGSVETFEDVQSNIFAMYDENRGPSEAPPHLADSHVMTSVPGLPAETIWFRITGRLRPLGVGSLQFHLS